MEKGIDSYLSKFLDEEYHNGFNAGYIAAMKDYDISDNTKAIKRGINIPTIKTIKIDELKVI